MSVHVQQLRVEASASSSCLPIVHCPCCSGDTRGFWSCMTYLHLNPYVGGKTVCVNSSLQFVSVGTHWTLALEHGSSTQTTPHNPSPCSSPGSTCRFLLAQWRGMYVHHLSDVANSFCLCFGLVKLGPLWRALCVSRRESQSKANCNNPGVVQHRSYRSTNYSVCQPFFECTVMPKEIESTVHVFNFSLPQYHHYKLSLLFHMHSRSQHNVSLLSACLYWKVPPVILTQTSCPEDQWHQNVCCYQVFCNSIGNC